MHPALQALETFTARPSVDLTLLAAPRPEEAAYPPLAGYVLALSRRTKPETAAEELFRALLHDVLGDQLAFSQVGGRHGFPDYLFPEGNGAVVLELKPLFHRHSDHELRRSAFEPKHHLEQVRKYLHSHEYVILTNLDIAYLFSARDTLVNGSCFGKLPFAELLARQHATRSFLDVLRRAEDAVEKPELDRQFFADLKEWYRVFEKVAFTPAPATPELIILLINKLVFAKTVEDHGLVPYRFIQDEYEKQKDRWGTKGPRHTLRVFLANFEEFFDAYYDTELFARRIWGHVEQSPDNLERFARALELVLGVAPWDQVFSRGIVHYNYRQINEDIFGKSYEMFLAANRKDEGIYYTPASVTAPMADGLVDTLFGPLVDEACACVASDRCDFARAAVLMDQLAQIRIADTAAGSGGFLIKALRAIWRQYQRLDAASAWVRKAGRDLFDLPPSVRQAGDFRLRHSFDARRVLIARLLLRHLFALDKDGGALEVAKTNVWKEAIKLSEDDYNYRRLKADAERILPNLSLNFLCADSLVDVDPARQAAHLHEYSRHALRDLARLREAYIADPSNHAPLDEALALRAKLRANLAEHFAAEPLPAPPAFVALEFFPCWFEADGSPRPNGGFDGLIGNPPWEAVKPVRKEFAHIAKYSMSVGDFDTLFAKRLAEDADFNARWDEYEASYDAYKLYLSQRFVHQGTGDWNLFKLFIENNLRLVRDGGRLSLLVPSSLQTDEGCGALRRLFITEHTLEELTSFENRGYTKIEDGKETSAAIFPDVDSRFKFGFFKVIKNQPTPEHHVFDARFYLTDPARVYDPPIKYSVEMVRRFSPKNLSFMEFRSEADYELYSRIRGAYPLLGDLNFVFRRELHMTGDSAFFQKRNGRPLVKGELPLYEGKMIYQYEGRFKPSNSLVREEEVRPQLFRKELHRLARLVGAWKPAVLEGQPLPRKKDDLDALLTVTFRAKQFRLQYELPRLAYREVGRSTDERTFIAAVVPAGVCLAHTLMYLSPYTYEVGEDGTLHQRPQPADEMTVLLALFNSLVLNYYLRSKVSAHVSIFQLNELPIPPLTPAQRATLAAAAEALSLTPGDLAARARLEAFIARDLYGLSAADWRHLTGTFTFGGDSASKADLDEIIRQSTALAEGW